MRFLFCLIRLSVLGVLPIGSAFGAPNFIFYDSFDGGINSSPYADLRWSWKEPFSESNPFGMMLGKGDLYEVSENVAFRGNASLRLDFDGRNGWCNTCGADSYIVANGVGNSVILQATEQGILENQPNPNRPVFNKSDRWARWTPESTGDQSLFFNGGAPTRNELGGSGLFNGGDEVFIARECGVDGNIGRDIDRRSDCNLGINYLQGVSASDFEPGESIARRFYMYVAEETEMPNTTLKLGYTWFRNEENGRYHVYPLLRSGEISAATRLIVGAHSFPGKRLESGAWYYLEEVYTRESSDSANDGTYKLYFDRHDEVTNVPLVSLENITFGELLDMSVVGNWQHSNDAKGYFYIDEVAVADGYIGPVDGDLKEAAPPNAPAAVNVD
jgi:hypothetical protein